MESPLFALYGCIFLEKRSMRHTRIVVTRYGGPDAIQVVEE